MRTQYWHEGFPFAVEEQHGAKDVAGRRRRSRASAIAAGDLHGAAVASTSATVNQGLPTRSVLDTVASVANARFGVRSTPRTARASAFEAVDQPISTSGEVDVEVASSDSHDRARGGGGFTVGATVAVRERSGRHDVAGFATPDGVTAAHRVAVVNLSIESSEGRSRGAASLVAVDLNLADGSSSAQREAVSQLVAAGVVHIRAPSGLAVLGPRSVGTIGHRTRIGHVTVEGHNIAVALGTAGQSHIVHIEIEHVAAVEVTDGNVNLLTGVSTQVNAVLRPSALVAHTARSIITIALLANRPLVHHREITSIGTSGGNGNAEVLSSVVCILAASPEAEG